MMKPFTLNHVHGCSTTSVHVDLEFYVRTRACEKRESEKQPLVSKQRYFFRVTRDSIMDTDKLVALICSNLR